MKKFYLFYTFGLVLFSGVTATIHGQEIFCDNFDAGSSNWTITNDGGTCVWDISTLARPYTMPNTATGNVFAADEDLCGSGTSLLSTATINQTFNFIGADYLYIEFDNDWRVLGATDEAHLEGSTDGGTTWVGLWDRVGVDARNTHEMVDASILEGHSDCQIRLRSVQPGWDWWWAIDNFCIYGSCPACPPPITPTNLTAIVSGFEQVQLNWQDNSLNELAFVIERKDGDSLSGNSFYFLESIPAGFTYYLDYSVTDSLIYTYRVYAYNQFGQSGYSNLAQILVWVPVELVSFTATSNKKDINLNWITATEINNSGFQVERLKYSKIEGSHNWEAVNFIEGHGTTTETQHYSYTDKNLTSGKYQYRLKQIDYDGSYEYSPVVESEIQLPNEFILEQNYPNPFNPVTKIKFTIPQDGRREARNVSLKVYDVLGREVATLVNEEKSAGEYEITFDAAKLSSGIYYYELKSGDFRLIKKMILLK
jgi:Secretion system C-terminal sorting domain